MKHRISRHLAFFLMLTTFAIGSTFNSISDAGNGYGQTWDNTNEEFTRSDGQGLKLTWDSDEVFIEVSGDNEHFIYFSGSSGTTSGKPWDVTPTLPFDAQYLAVIRPWDGGLNNGYSWNGSDWNSTFTVTYIAHHNTNKSKTVKINTSALGSQSSIKFCAFAKPNGSSSWIGGYVPSDASTSGDPSSTDSEVLTKYYSYGSSVWLQASQNPNGTDYSLPVELSIFSARSSSQGVELNWTTDSEVENQGFILSRKMEGSSWDEIASFASHQALQGQGSTTNASNYSFVDTDVRDGISYTYQLSDVDYGGNVTHHSDQARTITYVNPGAEVRPQTLDLVRLYPNPFNPSVTLSYDLLEMTDLNVSVYDLTGELVWSHSIASHPAGQNYTLTWNGSDRQNSALPSGIYLVYIQAGRQSLSQKVTLLR